MLSSRVLSHFGPSPRAQIHLLREQGSSFAEDLCREFIAKDHGYYLNVIK